MDIPRGFRQVYNRLAEPYEKQFDGAPFVFAPHETRMLAQDLAEFLSDTSVFKYDMALSTVEKALVLDGDELFEQPYEGSKPVELIDRSVDDNPLGRNSDLKTHAEVRQVPGAIGEIRREMSMKPAIAGTGKFK